MKNYSDGLYEKITGLLIQKKKSQPLCKKHESGWDFLKLFYLFFMLNDRPVCWTSKQCRQFCVGIALRCINLSLSEKDTSSEIDSTNVSSSKIGTRQYEHFLCFCITFIV